MKQQMIQARKDYIELIKKELLGPGSDISIPDEEHEIISNLPEKHYSVGILFPRDSKMNADNDDLQSQEENISDGEDVDNDSNTSDHGRSVDINKENNWPIEEENLDEEISLTAQNMPSSAGITFFADGNTDNINCHISFATYKKVTAKDCRMPFFPDNPDLYSVPDELGVYLYFDKNESCLKFKCGGFSKKEARRLQEKIDVDEYGLINSMFRLCEQLFQGYLREPHEVDLSLDFSNSDYIDANKNLDNTVAKVTALRRKVGDLYAITIMLVNDDDNKPNGVNCIFQPEIMIDTSCNEFVFREYSRTLSIESLADEEQSLELQYRNKKIYATGLGTSANWEIDDNGKGYVCNDYFPEVEVPTMDFTMEEKYNVNPKTFSMKYLSDLNDISKEEKISNLKDVIDAYKTWIYDKEKEIETLPDEFKIIAQKNITGCKKSYGRMEAGVEKLIADSTVWDAFQLANRAMYMQRIHIVLQNKTSDVDRFPGDEMLADLLGRISNDYASADAIDVLSKDHYAWRPFQLAFLLMSIVSITEETDDRELVDLIWFPTGGGKTEAYLGLTALTIFYRRMQYPEESNGTSVIMRYTLRLLAAQQFTRASTLICACEFIRQDSNERRPKYKKYSLGKEPITIGLWIGSEHTPNKNTEAKRHLAKLYDAKSDLKYAKEKHNKFQVLKCPWCGTKLVKELDGSGNKTKGSYGYRMQKGKYFQMFCTNEECTFNKCDYLPIQIVDEELYKYPPTLLFGTVDKFAMMPWNDKIGAYFGIGSNNRPPELIIQDELHLISGPLGTIVGLYETALDELCKAKGTKPKIVASTATIRRAKEQCAALYDRAVAQFPHPGLDAEDSFFAREAAINHDDNKYGRTYIGIMPSGKTKAMMEIRSIAALMQSINMMDLESQVKDKLWTLTVYFNSLKDLGKCSTLINDDVRSFIRIMAARTGSFKNARKIYNVDELTSRVSTTELNETLDKLEKRTYTDDESNNRGVSSVLIATNMISVGIDVARLNVMLMVGQPKLTSEYIQASSRVGRSFPGVAFVMYDGSKSRDRSHYEQFKSYHESFYKYVEPTGVTPFSKPARDRALHSIVITIMRYLNKELSGETDASGFSVEKYEADIENIKAAVVERSKSISERLGSHMSDDSAEIETEILRVFEKWEALANEYKDEVFTYGNKFMFRHPQKNEGRLLKAFNTDANDTNNFEAMTSMRNVDSTVAGNVLIWEK